MPVTFILVGLLLLIAAVRGKDSELLDLLKSDLTERPSFLPWIVSILLIGSLGYISSVRTISRAMLALVIVVLFISNKGFFKKLTEALPEVFGAKEQ